MRFGSWILLFGFIAISTLSLTGCSSEESTSETGPTVASPEPKQEPAESATEKPFTLETLPDPEGDDGGYSIAQTMKYAHDNRLFRRLYKSPVALELGERIKVLYASLPEQTPPKGDAQEWKKRASDLVDAANRLIEGEADALVAYKRAVNCNSCHSTFRP